MKKFSTEIRVRYAETDAMKVVYHSNYLVWMEVARVLWFDTFPFPYKALEEKGFYLPVLEANVKYLKPLYFDDRVRIDLVLNSPVRARLRLSYEFYRLQGDFDQKVAEGFSSHGFINAQFKAVIPPREWMNWVRDSDKK